MTIYDVEHGFLGCNRTCNSPNRHHGSLTVSTGSFSIALLDCVGAGPPGNLSLHGPAVDKQVAASTTPLTRQIL